MATTILIVLRSFETGGAERQLLEFLRGADKRRLAITVATFYRGPWHDDASAIPGISIVNLRKKGRYATLSLIRDLAVLANSVRPDVVYGYMSVSNLLASLVGRMVSAKVVWGIRNSSLPEGDKTVLGRTLAAVSPMISRSVDLLIANSKAGVRFYSGRGYPIDRFVVVHNGIDVNHFARQREGRATLRKTLGLTDGDLALGLVARVIPGKGHLEALQALAGMGADGRRVTLCFAGTVNPGFGRRVTSYLRDLGLESRVKLLGHVGDMPTLYSAMDVCLLPSRAEGFPNAVAEAMACETPCVATNVGDISDLLGDTGVLVPTTDPIELIRGIRCMLHTDLRQLGTRARDRVRELYSTDHMVEEMTATFERLAAGQFNQVVAASPV